MRLAGGEGEEKGEGIKGKGEGRKGREGNERGLSPIYLTTGYVPAAFAGNFRLK